MSYTVCFFFLSPFCFIFVRCAVAAETMDFFFALILHVEGNHCPTVSNFTTRRPPLLPPPPPLPMVIRRRRRRHPIDYDGSVFSDLTV